MQESNSFKKLSVAEMAMGADAIDLILDMPSSSRSSKLESPQDFQRNEIPSWFESSVEDLFSAMKPTLLSIGGRPVSEATGEAQLIYGSGSDMFNFKRHKLLWLSTISLETYLEMQFMKLNFLKFIDWFLHCSHNQKTCWGPNDASSSSDHLYGSVPLNNLLPSLPPMEQDIREDGREDVSNGIGDDKDIRLCSDTERGLPPMYLTDDLLHMVRTRK